MQANKMFIFKDAPMSDEIRVGVYNGDGFQRFYFYDQNPGNFALMIVTKGFRGDNIDIHAGVGEVNHRQLLEHIPAANIQAAMADIITTLQRKGFGKWKRATN